MICNVAVYLVLKLVWLLTGDGGGFTCLLAALVLDSDITAALSHPWTMLSYSTVQIDFLHLSVNMLWLLCFGMTVKEFWGRRVMLAVFVAGAVAGALSYLAAHTFVDLPHGQLAGASAAVMSLIGAATIVAPRYRLRVALLGSLPLWAMAIIGMMCFFSTSPGAFAAHAGGLLAGVSFGAMVRYRRRQVARLTRRALMRREEHNIIITKVRNSGFASLSTKERLQLFDMSDGYKKQ